MPTAVPFPDLTNKRLRELQKQAVTKRQFQWVQCLALRQQGGTSEDIAAVLAISTATVRRVWSDYRTHGYKAILKDSRGGRYNENMPLGQEQRFLASFLQQAATEGVLIVNDIHRAYEKELGRTVPKSTIYAMLDRNGWRKIVPRPQHPQGNPGAREIFQASFPPDR